jgi:hypothetical protein
MDDQIGRPHNLVPSYQDRSSFCAPKKVEKFKTNNTTELQSRVLRLDNSEQENFRRRLIVGGSSGSATRYRAQLTDSRKKKVLPAYFHILHRRSEEFVRPELGWRWRLCGRLT